MKSKKLKREIANYIEYSSTYSFPFPFSLIKKPKTGPYITFQPIKSKENYPTFKSIWKIMIKLYGNNSWKQFGTSLLIVLLTFFVDEVGVKLEG